MWRGTDQVEHTLEKNIDMNLPRGSFTFWTHRFIRSENCSPFLNHRVACCQSFDGIYHLFSGFGPWLQACCVLTHTTAFKPGGFSIPICIGISRSRSDKCSLIPPCFNIAQCLGPRSPEESSMGFLLDPIKVHKSHMYLTQNTQGHKPFCFPLQADRSLQGAGCSSQWVDN